MQRETVVLRLCYFCPVKDSFNGWYLPWNALRGWYSLPQIQPKLSNKKWHGKNRIRSDKERPQRPLWALGALFQRKWKGTEGFWWIRRVVFFLTTLHLCLLLENKFPRKLVASNNAHLLSHSFHGKGVQAQLNWVFCLWSHEATVERSATLQSHLEAPLGKNLNLIHVLVDKWLRTLRSYRPPTAPCHLSLTKGLALHGSSLLQSQQKGSLLCVCKKVGVT